MQPEIQLEPEKPEPVLEMTQEIDKELEQAKKNWGNLFDKDPRTAADEILLRIKPLLERIFQEDEVREMELVLQSCGEATTREEFVERVLLAVAPLVEFRSNNPREFKKTVFKINSEKIFNNNDKDPKRAMKEILQAEDIPGQMLEAVLAEQEQSHIKEILKDCENSKDGEEFLEKAFLAIDVLGALRDKFRSENPKEFEKMLRGSRIEGAGENITRLSEVLYCDEKEGGRRIGVHLATAKTLGVAELNKSVQEGLENLARIINGKKETEEVVLTSWILGKNQKVVKKLFGDIGIRIISDDEKKERGLIMEKPVGEAIISRDNFLQRYLKEK